MSSVLRNVEYLLRRRCPRIWHPSPPIVVQDIDKHLNLLVPNLRELLEGTCVTEIFLYLPLGIVVDILVGPFGIGLGLFVWGLS